MSGPHQGQPLQHAGAPLETADAAVVMLHGRGATAEDILTLAGELSDQLRPTEGRVAYLAPQAAGFTWYPNSFLAPIDSNQPGLGSALEAVGAVLERTSRAGVSAERQVLLGFSQGACLALEYAARNARRYGGVIGFTGGLIGPPGTARDYEGDFENTPVFLGSADPDPHVPWTRVEETADVFRRLGASVKVRRYPGMGHTVNREELELASRLITAASEGRGDRDSQRGGDR